MYRYTTPTITINLVLNDVVNEDVLNTSDLYVTISQGGKKLTKTQNDILIDNNTIGVTLTQCESADFSEGYAWIQVRGVTPDGFAWASKVGKFRVENTLLKREI